MGAAPSVAVTVRCTFEPSASASAFEAAVLALVKGPFTTTTADNVVTFVFTDAADASLVYENRVPLAVEAGIDYYGVEVSEPE